MSTLAVPAQRARSPVPAQRHTADTPWSLVEQAQAGDMDAWAAIWQANRGRVHRFVRSRIYDHHLAEDIVSAVFVKALASLDRVTWQGRDVGAFLFTIARNLMADHFKGATYKREIVGGYGDPDHPDESPDRPDHAPTPDEQVADYLRNRTLIAAVRTLTADQQEVIILRYLRGLDTNETAAVLGKEVGAVKALTYRAVRALARIPEVAALRGDP